MEKQRLYTVFPFLSELTEKQKKQFEDYFETAPNWVLDDCQVAELGKNDVLLRENTAVDTVYFVGKGAFKGGCFNYRKAGYLRYKRFRG